MTFQAIDGIKTVIVKERLEYLDLTSYAVAHLPLARIYAGKGTRFACPPTQLMLSCEGKPELHKRPSAGIPGDRTTCDLGKERQPARPSNNHGNPTCPAHPLVPSSLAPPAVGRRLWNFVDQHASAWFTRHQLSSMGTIQTTRPPGLPELQSRPPVTSRLAAVATHCISNGAIWT
ncbi:hypothetical protein MY3296_002718 [Beauveria thailandica]